jgi:hypothetical protein
LEFSLRCEYLNLEKVIDLDEKYNQVLAQIITMIDGADKMAD